MRNPARKDSRQAVLRLVPAPGKSDPIHLPPPRISGTHSLEECLARRRSTREFASEPLLLADVGQLLWAAQGVTATGGLRTAPSPGAIYPLRVYLVTANVRSIDPGVYRYDPDEHALCPVWRGEPRRRFLEAALGQECVSGCAAMIALSAVYRRVTREFGEHGVRLAQMEAGHAGQNPVSKPPPSALAVSVSAGSTRRSPAVPSPSPSGRTRFTCSPSDRDVTRAGRLTDQVGHGPRLDRTVAVKVFRC